MPSPVEICNMALLSLGHEGIRDFDKSTKAERVCEVAYSTCLKQLFIYDWSFGRGVADLRVTDGAASNEYGTAYDLPIDCKRPLDIFPIGTRQRWVRIGKSIYTNVPSPKLLYTKHVPVSGDFPDYFVIALARSIEAEIAPAMKQDDKTTRTSMSKAQTALLEALDADARSNNEYRNPDNDPNYDTFVDPDVSEGTSSLENWYGNTQT